MNAGHVGEKVSNRFGFCRTFVETAIYGCVYMTKILTITALTVQARRAPRKNFIGHKQVLLIISLQIRVLHLRLWQKPLQFYQGRYDRYSRRQAVAKSIFYFFPCWDIIKADLYSDIGTISVIFAIIASPFFFYYTIKKFFCQILCKKIEEPKLL